jgi:hypothetical protein
MAVEAKWPKQFSVVCSVLAKALLKAEAAERKVSEADIVREAVSLRYGLTPDGLAYLTLVGQVGQE